MVVLQQSSQQIQCLRRALVPIFRGEKHRPGLSWVLGHGSAVCLGDVESVSIAVLSQVLGAEHLADLHQLVAIVGSLEQRLSSEELRFMLSPTPTTAPSMQPAENMSSE